MEHVFSLDQTEVFRQLWKRGSRRLIIGNWVRLAMERLWFWRLRFKQRGLHGSHRIADDSKVYQTSPVAQKVKCLPAMRETWVRSLGREDTLQKEMATHSSILAWKIPWREEPGGLQSRDSQRVGQDWVTSFHFTSLHSSVRRSRCLDRHSEERSPDENR